MKSTKESQERIGQVILKIFFTIIFVLNIGKCYSQNEEISISITASKDAYICEEPNSSSSNFGTKECLLLSMWKYDEGIYRSRVLMSFDLSSIPSNAQINNATLKLSYIGDGKYNDPRFAYLYRATSNWEEDSVTWNNQPTYSDSRTERKCLAEYITKEGNYYINIPEFAIRWHEGTNPNYGVVLSMDELTEISDIELASRENGKTELRPELVITYILLPVASKITAYEITNNLLRKTNTDSTTVFSQVESINSMAWTSWGSRTTQRSLLRFDISTIPNGAENIEAMLILKGNGHIYYPQLNSSYLLRVVDQWNNGTVNWANQPKTTSDRGVPLESSTSLNQNYTVDISGFVNGWYNKEYSNNGLLLKQVTESDYRSMNFFSSSNSLVTNLPYVLITYKIPDPPNGYGILKKTLDAGFYSAVAGKIYFTYFEEYEIGTDKYLQYKLKDQQGNIVISCSGDGTALPVGSPTKPLRHGTNYFQLSLPNYSSSSLATYFILEVENPKGEKYYLRIRNYTSNGT